MSRTCRWNRPPASAGNIFFALCLLLLVPFLTNFGWNGLLPHRSQVQTDAQSRRLGSSASSLSESGVQSSGGHSSEDHHKSGAFNPIVFALVTYTISACAQQAQSILPGIMHHIPHTVLLFLIGMIMGAWEHNEGPGEEYREMIADFKLIDPHIVFWILLPTLLYEDAAGADWHVVKRVMPNSLILAFPGVMCNTVLTASILMAWSSATDDDMRWDWEPAMLLGSILSATDPVAVVGALHALQAPAKLSSLISGESLFNDGTAVALFQIFWNLTAGREDWDLGWAIGKLLWLAVGGPVLGMLFSIVAYVWLSNTKNFHIEILICVVCIFASFFVAEHPKVGVSGVLAVVTFGFYMSSTGKYAMEVEHEHKQHAVIEFLALLSNEAIFVIAGIVTFGFMVDDVLKGKDWLDLIFLYGVIHATRSIVILLFYPLIKNLGYGLTWKEAVIVVFGGLRGAVGLALGLLVISDSMIEPSRLRVKIAFHTSGIVFLTLCINGTIVTHVYKALKIASPERQEHHERLLNLGLKYADLAVIKVAAQLKTHWFFFNCNFDVVKMLIPHLDEHVTDSLDIFGRRKMIHKTQQQVRDAMTKLAESQAWKKEVEVNNKLHMHDRYMAKVRYYNKAANKESANAFLFSSSVYNSDHSAEAQDDMTSFSIYLVAKHRLVLEKSTDRSLAKDLEQTLRLRSKDVNELFNKVAIKAWLEDAINTSESKVSGKTSGQQRARQNWKIAKRSGDAVVTVLSDLRKQSINFGEIQEEQAWKDELAGEPEEDMRMMPSRIMNAKRSESKKGNFTTMYQLMAHAGTLGKHGSQKENHDSAEQAMLEEAYQNIVNVTKADYKAMYEAGTLGREPYQFLLESVAIEEEAIHGDFKKWKRNERLEVDHLSTAHAIHEEEVDERRRIEEERGGVEASATPSVTKSLESKQQSKSDYLVSETPMEAIEQQKDLQKQSGFEVAFRYIQDMLHRPRADWKNFVYWLLNGSQSVLFEWFILRRNIEVLLAFLFTTDHIQKEVSAISSVSAKVGKQLRYFSHKARYDLLFQVFDLHPAMFFLFEHLLYAKIIIKYQKNLVHKLAEEGTITHEDAHHISKAILQPSEKAIAAYVPDLQTLKAVYMQRAKKRLYTKNDWIFLLLLRLSKAGNH